MLDLRDDGTIAIDFDGENPTQVVIPRPIVMVIEEADFKRIDIAAGAEPLAEEIQARDPQPSRAEIQKEIMRWGADQAADWWNVVVVGMIGVELPPREQWPPWMLYGQDVLPTIIAHWKHVPLARGGRLVPTS